MIKDKRFIVGLIGFSVISGWVFFAVVAPAIDNAGGTNTSAHLDCLDRPDLPSGYERTDFQNLTKEQQSLVLEASKPDEFPDLNRSQANFFKSHSAIRTNETVYYCEVLYP